MCVTVHTQSAPHDGVSCSGCTARPLGRQLACACAGVGATMSRDKWHTLRGPCPLTFFPSPHAQTLEAQEEVADASGDAPKLRQLLEDNQTRQQRLVQELAAAFREGRPADAGQLTTRLTYLDRLQRQITEKL